MDTAPRDCTDQDLVLDRPGGEGFEKTCSGPRVFRAAGFLLAFIACLAAAAACGPRQGGGPPRGAAPPSGKNADAALPAVDVGDDGLKTGLAPADAGLAARVKERLAADPRLSGMKLEVDAQGGRVTLWGQAGNAEARSAAEQVARGTPGAQSVRNLIDARGAAPRRGPH